MKIVAPDEHGLARAAEAIHAGEVVAYPTETVYGLAVDPFNERALQRLVTMKVRDPGKPVLLIAADVAQLRRMVAALSPRAEAYAHAFWPGPLSLLFEPAAWLPAGLSAGSGKVCVRCPGCAVARALCTMVGHPVTSTSANLSGRPPAAGIDEIRLSGIAVGIDGGRLPSRGVSTIFDPDTGHVLRHGVITESQLSAVAAKIEDPAG